MTVLGTSARGRSAMLAVAAVGVILLAWFAASADLVAGGATPATTALDLAAGLAFLLAGLPAAGALTERLLISAVGPAWLAGSVFASARSLHQGVLAVALLAFPSGRVSGAPRRLVALCAIVVTFEVVPQLGVAAMFGAIALLAVLVPDSSWAGSTYPAAAAAAVAAALTFSWWALRHSTAASPFGFYATTVIAVAIAFPFATRAVARSRDQLTDRVLGDTRLTGLPGLRLVLAEALNDPNLEIHLWDADASRYVNPAGGDVPAAGSPGGGLTVLDRDELLGRVLTTSPALADGPTADAVAAALRLAVVNSHLRDEQTRLLADVEASRTRLLAATDKERERVADRLRTGAGECLQDAHTKLAATTSAGDPGSSALVEFTTRQVTAAAADVQRIVAGAPPEALGGGRLQAAIESLTASCPTQVTVYVSGDVACDADLETALFYVCSESLANSSKHAGATHVVVDLQRQDNEVTLRVHDNGRGGADTAGSGLQGLADRLAAAGGQLTVTSPVGGGTTILASVPLRRSEGSAPTSDSRRGR